MSDETGTTAGSGTRETARRETEQVTGTAKDAASNVGGSARQRGRELQGQAKGHARDLARTAEQQLRGHAQEEAQRAGTALRNAGDQLRALAEGRIDEAGVFGDYVEQAADVVTRWADTINERGFDGMLDDLRSTGRRRPGLFLGGALLAGVLVGRFGRNVTQELSGDDQPASVGATSSGSTTGAGGDGPAGADAAPSDAGTASTRAQPSSPPPASAPTGVDEVRPTGVTNDDAPARTGDDRSGEIIVGQASDDRGVVVPDDGPRSDGAAVDDPEYRPINVDQGPRR